MIFKWLNDLSSWWKWRGWGDNALLSWRGDIIAYKKGKYQGFTVFYIADLREVEYELKRRGIKYE